LSKAFSIEDLLPQYYFKALIDAKPDDIEQQIKFDLNLDEEYKFEVITAFSYYETLSEEEKIAVRKGLAEVKIADILNFIGQNNEILLDRIELLFDKKVPVIIWLTNQMNRGKAMILTFDQLISEGKKYESTIPK
jgi:hypothetical protein